MNVVEILKLESAQRKLFEHEFPVSELKAGDNYRFCRNHVVNLIMLEEINVDVWDFLRLNRAI